VSRRVSHATGYLRLGGGRAEIEALLDELGWAWCQPLSLLLDEAVVIEENRV
jgi:hypothetical protein